MPKASLSSSAILLMHKFSSYVPMSEVPQVKLPGGFLVVSEIFSGTVRGCHAKIQHFIILESCRTVTASVHVGRMEIPSKVTVFPKISTFEVIRLSRVSGFHLSKSQRFSEKFCKVGKEAYICSPIWEIVFQQAGPEEKIRRFVYRGVAQLASASGLGPEGPVFESQYPDIMKRAAFSEGALFFLSMKPAVFPDNMAKIDFCP